MTLFSPYRMETDPGYWWFQAHKYRKAVAQMINCNGDKDIIVLLSVDALERAIKAVLAEKKLIDDECDTHSLIFLTKEKSSLYDEFNETQKSLILNCTRLHSDSSYPPKAKEYSLWYDEDTFVMIVKGCADAVSELEGQYRGQRGTE